MLLVRTLGMFLLAITATASPLPNKRSSYVKAQASSLHQSNTTLGVNTFGQADFNATINAAVASLTAADVDFAAANINLAITNLQVALADLYMQDVTSLLDDIAAANDYLNAVQDDVTVALVLASQSPTYGTKAKRTALDDIFKQMKDDNAVRHEIDVMIASTSQMEQARHNEEIDRSADMHATEQLFAPEDNATADAATADASADAAEDGS